MGTRAMIARWTAKEEGKFKGNYHHWDGYPSGLGKALYYMSRYTFGSVDKMLRVLIDQHPGGWSTVIGCDWTLSPGWDSRIHEEKDGRPECHCHGDRHDMGPYTFEGQVGKYHETDLEYAYVFEQRTEERAPNSTYMSSFKTDPPLTMDVWYMSVLTRGYDGVWRYVNGVRLGRDDIDWDELNEQALAIRS